MAVEPPPVDPRDFAGLVRATKQAIRAALPELPKPAPGEDPPVPGEGLVHIFARLAEIVSERLNRVPEKNLLAFLSMLGLDQQPPQPARVPLTFELAKGATSARVPAGTTAAATAIEGEETPPTYETARELVVTPTQPVGAFVREPALDRYRDAGVVITPEPVAVPVFEGDQPIRHEYFVGDRLLELPQPKDVTLRIAPASAASRWPDALSWSVFDGAQWQPVADPSVAHEDAGWTLRFVGLKGVVPSPVANVTRPWLRARLDTPLPPPEALDGNEPPPYTLQQAGLAPDAALAEDWPQDPAGPFAPFGTSVPRQTFSLACERAFSKPGADITLAVDVDTSVIPTPSANLVLTWRTWDPAVGWRTLGISSPGMDPAPQGPLGFTDGTRAFSRDGAIAFHAPPGWTRSQVALSGGAAHWLQVTISAGGFGSPPAFAAPVLRRIAISYTWPQPVVEGMTRVVTIERKGLVADALLADDEPLDASKDFLPFGEQPSFNDAFYVACDEALSLPNARVKLHITGTRQARVEDDPQVTWEVYNGELGRWEAAAVDEDATGDLTFKNGAAASVILWTTRAPAPVELADGPRHCLRARLTAGGYGGPAIIETATDANHNTVITTTPATWNPPSVQSIAIDYRYVSDGDQPDGVVTHNDFETTVPQGAHVPFTVAPDRRPTFYVALDGDFANRPTMLFFDVAGASYAADADRAAPPAEPAQVAWEYRNAAGWQTLGTRDETRGFSARGLLTFVAPADMARSTQFGVDAHWLRARWERGGYAAPPRLARVLTNTVWASNVATVRDEVLGSSTGEENQAFRTARAPILPGQQIEVRELGVPSAVELAAILAEQGDDAVTPLAAEPGRPAETWVRWHPVVDFYGSGPRSRHYVVDRLRGELRFGDGRRGMAPPQGRGNVRATAYRTGGGAGGNRSAGAITQLKSAVPYVVAVTNPAPAAGGADAEPLDAVRERGPRMLRHGNRAVTIGDVEDLARDASAEVARVLGVAATSAADAGSVGVVVVPASPARQPVPSLELLERVRTHLEQRLPLGAALWVAGPGWVRIDVTADVVPVSLEDATDVENAVTETLERFLHPLSGGPQGASWAFGRTPRRSDLLAVIEGVAGVDHVRGLAVAATQTAPEPVPGATLLYSGAHAITMAGSTDEAAP